MAKAQEKYQVDHVSPANSSLQPFPIGDFGIPCNWDSDNHGPSNHKPYTLARLSEKCWEYSSIESEFTRAGAQVFRVDRIENKELWEKFEAESRRMLRTRTNVNEVYLLHGSKGKKEDICHEGLDQRLSRIGHFGRGIYFSNDVRKCFNYTRKDDPDDKLTIEQRKCTVYKCRVLLGIVKVYPKGQNDKLLKREPTLDNPGPGGLRYYDSVKGQVSDYEEFIVYKSERVLPEYIISCLPPKTPLPASTSQPVQSAVTSEQMVAMSPTTNGHSNSTSPTNSVELDDEEVLELKYFTNSNEKQRQSSVTSAGGLDDKVNREGSLKTARGAVGGTREERSGSVGAGEEEEEETCESAGEDMPEGAEEDMCESAGEDDYQSAGEDVCESAGEEEDLYSASMPSSKTPQDTAAPNSSASAEDTTQTQEESNGTSSSVAPVYSSEDEFQKHLEEVRRRVQEKRRAEAANPPLARANSETAVSQGYEAPTQGVLDDEHQKRLLEVRRRVREKRLKEGKLSTSDENSLDEDGIDEPEENVNQVMSSLLAQFLEFTGCEDPEVAGRYIRHAQMDVNDAIMMYLNAS